MEQSPLCADFEPQRHWMEVTIYEPFHRWYTQTHFNDLDYWGLENPPLSGMHSYLLGMWAKMVNESFVMPYESRGLKTDDLVNFMRQTVQMSDVVFFIACVYYYYSIAKKAAHIVRHITEFLFLALAYPALIMVDHALFHYNCVSLGLTVAAVACLYNGHKGSAAMFYSLAVNHNQLTLYYALPFIVYFVEKYWNAPTFQMSKALLVRISFTALLTFFVLWMPFLLSDESSISHVFGRIFPVTRGIFRDNSWNVWGLISFTLNLQEHFSPQVLAAVSATCTLLVATPSLVCLDYLPTFRQFLLCLINVSLAFHLFFFQVDEMSILFVALPVILYAHYDLPACCWFLLVSHVSLLHLAKECEGLEQIHDALALTFFIYLCSNRHFFLRESLESLKWFLRLWPTIAMTSALYFGYENDRDYPFFWPQMNAIYSCTHFVGFLIYFTYDQIRAARQWGHEPAELVLSPRLATAPREQGVPLRSARRD